MNNIVFANLGYGNKTTTQTVFQYNMGMMLRFKNVTLPDTYRVDFSNSLHGTSKTMIGGADGVEIPYEYFVPGSHIYAWIVLSMGENDAITEYQIEIPIDPRAKPTDVTPTPSQQSAIDQAISALNSGVERAETAAESAEQAVADVQETVDAALQEAKDSGEFDGADGVSPTATVTQTSTGATITVTDAQGTTTAEISNGQDGEPGTPGAPGTDGVSPTVSVTDIDGGHRITITDATGPHSFDVMNGEGGGAVQDVQVNNVSVLSDGVANVPLASNDGVGVIRTYSDAGTQMLNNILAIVPATAMDIKEARPTMFHPIIPRMQHNAVFYGLAKAAGDTTQSASSNAVGIYTESAKSAIHEMLNGDISVSGTTPVINALPGVRYVCGEVATLEIIVPESGIVDVTFESGTTATVLTITPPTGVTLKWANGFDPDNLDADTTYEINIMDGLGVAGSWT